MLTPSYIQYADNSSYTAASNVQTTDSLFQSEQEIVGGAMVGKKGGCNISFDSAFDIDFNIPEFNFFETASSFDTSLFDKIDQLSGEIAGINNMLIDAIVDMDCCEIADAYNGSVVPFFKFFADTEGDSVMDIIITMAEVITAVKAIVEPLECLMPLLPGNPWVIKDIDFLSWIYGFWKESGPLLDKFFSGEFLDMLIGPVHDVRKQLQACLGYSGGHAMEYNDTHVGSGTQIAKLAAMAAKNGNQVTAAQILKPKEVVAPIKDQFRTSEEFEKATNSYETAQAAYLLEMERYNDVVKSVSQQTEIQKNINANLAIATQTQHLFKLSTDGICGCIADVLGLQDISIIPMPVKTTSDLNTLIGKTINGLTNKQAGTASKDRLKKEPLTVREEDLKSKKTVDAILNSSPSKGKTQKAKKGKEEHTKVCPYSAAGIPVGQGVIAETCPVIELSVLSGPPAIKDANDDKVLYQKDMNTLLANVGAKTKQDQEAFLKAFTANEKIASSIITAAQATLNDTKMLTYSKETQDIIQINNGQLSSDLLVAQIIYDNMFGTFTPFDFIADPEELNYTSLWLTDDILDMMYSGISGRSVDNEEVRVRAMAELPPELRSIPFPPSTPPQNVINDLPLSTTVEQDTRKEINYFDAGFVRQGEPLWRNFNLLDIEFNDFSINEGAVSRDKTRAQYAAIFPNDTIGNAAIVKYLQTIYPSTTISHILTLELAEPNSTNIEYVEYILLSKYSIDSGSTTTSLNQEELLIVSQEIANMNGFKRGDLWVRTRSVQEDVQFGANYTMVYSGDMFETLDIGSLNRSITYEEKRLIELAYGTQSVDPATAMMKISNKNLEDRAGAYKKEMQHFLQESATHLALDNLNESLNNSIASMVRTEVNLTIPCTCDGIMCMVINQIIQKVLSAFDQMIDQIMNTITQFIIPDWVKDIMALIQEYINCYMSMFGIPAKIKEVHEEAKSLKEDLKGRVNKYPMGACFVPDDVFPDKPVVDKPVSSECVSYLPGPVCAPNPCDTWGGSCPQTSSCSSPTCSQSSCNVCCSGPCGIGIPSPVTCCVTGPCNVTEGCAGASNPCLSSTCSYLDVYRLLKKKKRKERYG